MKALLEEAVRTRNIVTTEDVPCLEEGEEVKETYVLPASFMSEG